MLFHDISVFLRIGIAVPQNATVMVGKVMMAAVDLGVPFVRTNPTG